MNILDLPMQAFKTLVLKPLDFVLFGGSGLLSRSRDEWRQVIQDSLPPAGSVSSKSYTSGSAEDGWTPYVGSADLIAKSSGSIAADPYQTANPPFENPPFSTDWSR